MTADRDVEAVAEVLAERFDEWMFRMHGVTSSCRHEAEAEDMAAALLPLIREREAAAWERGFASGKSRAMRYMSDEPGLSLDAANPYAGSEGE